MLTNGYKNRRYIVQTKLSVKSGFFLWPKISLPRFANNMTHRFPVCLEMSIVQIACANIFPVPQVKLRENSIYQTSWSNSIQEKMEGRFIESGRWRQNVYDNSRRRCIHVTNYPVLFTEMANGCIMHHEKGNTVNRLFRRHEKLSLVSLLWSWALIALLQDGAIIEGTGSTSLFQIVGFGRCLPWRLQRIRVNVRLPQSRPGERQTNKWWSDKTSASTDWSSCCWNVCKSARVAHCTFEADGEKPWQATRGVVLKVYSRYKVLGSMDKHFPMVFKWCVSWVLTWNQKLWLLKQFDQWCFLAENWWVTAQDSGGPCCHVILPVIAQCASDWPGCLIPEVCLTTVWSRWSSLHRCALRSCQCCCFPRR